MRQEKERSFVIFLFAKIRKITSGQVNYPQKALSQAKGLLQALPINWNPFHHCYFPNGATVLCFHCDQAFVKKCFDAFFASSMLIIGNHTITSSNDANYVSQQ